MSILTINRGLVTSPNELATPDGAADILDNCVIDFDNTVQSRRGFGEFGNKTDDDSVIKQLMTYKGRIIRHFSNKLSFDSTGNGTFLNFSGSYSELVSRLRIKYFELNSNLYFTSNEGIKKISAANADDFSQENGYITNAGAVKALGLEGAIIPNAAGFLPAQSKVAYKVLWAKKDANGNITRGVPSSRFVVTNTSKDINAGEEFTISVTTAGAGIHRQFNATTAVAGAVITINNHGYVNGTKVRFYGTIAPELDKGIDYFIVAASTNSFSVSLTSGGSAINLTTVSGTSNIYSGINNSHYFTFDTPTNKFACWFNISGEDVPPTDTGLVGRNLREVEIYKIATKNKENYMAKIAETLFLVSDIEVAASSNEVTVTNRDGGNVLDASAGNIDVSLLIVSTVFDGQTAIGTPANVNIEFAVPTEIITNNDKQYFYEIYRTAPITVATGLTLNDIDPGEEFQKIAEAPVAEGSAPILNNISYLDVAPETFRLGGLFLYTNPVTGEGALQSNELPPIAHDVAVFKNSAFYANTKERHRLQFNLLSVSQFTSGTSKLYIGNSQALREYTFIGQNEIVLFTAKRRSETVGNSYFDINSAQNKVKYRVWFDKGLINKSWLSAAVNISTERINIPDHGLATNDLIKISGTTSLPPGDYYAIRVDANNIQLKATLTGPVVNLTTAEGGSLTHTPKAPEQDSRILLRVALSGYPDTVQGSVDAFIDAFFDILDFLATDNGSGVIKLTYEDNGETDEIAQSNPATGWAVPFVDQEGFGENAAANEVLLSGLASQGLSVEDTARSLERVINKDANSPVSAYYLSGENDLPGLLLLESKSLFDDAFYLGFSHSTLTPVFEPTLPVVKPINSITAATLPNLSVIQTASNHEFANGQQVYTFIKPATSPLLLSGKKIISIPTGFAPDTFNIQGFASSTAYSSPASFEQAFIFSAEVSSDNSVNPNRVYFSKIGQPEAVPLVNYLDIGPRDKAIQRIMALRDSLIVLKEDGVYVITGPSAPNFSVRLSDSSALTFASDTATNLNNLIYVLTSQGVVTVSETGVGVISRNIENKIQEVANAKFNYQYMSWGLASESDRCYILWLPEKTTDEYSTQAFRYNTFTRTWTRWTKPANCGVVNPADDKIYLGDASNRPYVLKERKNFERQDYADREIVRGLGANAINGTTFTISSVSELEVGDSLVQYQYLDINKFNRFLKKLDRDSLNSNNYFDSLKASAGDSLAARLTNLVTKLQLDGIMAPASSGLENVNNIRADFNAIVNYLNSSFANTGFKNYKLVNDLLVYETIVTQVQSRGNLITVKYSNKFVQGDISFFKAIKCVVQYAPQHFGKPEVTKQVSEGTFVFDQNNFWGGTIGYSSDRSFDFKTIEFSGRGPGFWDGYSWANVTFGGEGNETPVRTLIPRDKSRCRYLHVQFKHSNAREEWKLIGVSLEPREVSTRGYR